MPQKHFDYLEPVNEMLCHPEARKFSGARLRKPTRKELHDLVNFEVLNLMGDVNDWSPEEYRKEVAVSVAFIRADLRGSVFVWDFPILDKKIFCSLNLSVLTSSRTTTHCLGLAFLLYIEEGGKISYLQNDRIPFA